MVQQLFQPTLNDEFETTWLLQRINTRTLLAQETPSPRSGICLSTDATLETKKVNFNVTCHNSPHKEETQESGDGNISESVEEATRSMPKISHNRIVKKKYSQEFRGLKPALKKVLREVKKKNPNILNDLIFNDVLGLVRREKQFAMVPKQPLKSIINKQLREIRTKNLDMRCFEYMISNTPKRKRTISQRENSFGAEDRWEWDDSHLKQILERCYLNIQTSPDSDRHNQKYYEDLAKEAATKIIKLLAPKNPRNVLVGITVDHDIRMICYEAGRCKLEQNVHIKVDDINVATFAEAIIAFDLVRQMGDEHVENKVPRLGQYSAERVKPDISLPGYVYILYD